jgi:peptidoglycan/LPS O-acetylase OafA/YrhL
MGALIGALLQLYLKRSIAGEYVSILSAFPFTALALPAPAGLLTEPFKLNPPTWSLFNELIANLIFALILYRLSSRTLIVLTAIASAALIWMAFSFGTINSGYRYGEIANGLIATAAPFMIGMLLNRFRSKPPRFLQIPFWLASIILLITFAIPTLPAGIEPPYQLILALCLYPAMIFLVKTSELSSAWKKVAYVSGYLSYPVYALHYPLLSMFDRAMEKMGGSSVIWLVVMTLGSVMIAATTAFWVEEPLRRWLSRLSRPAQALAPLPENSAGEQI